MARAGMALRRGSSHANTETSDDVQRSLELLDRVLSEFDDVENANQVQNVQQLTSGLTSPPSARRPAASTAVTTPGNDVSSTTPDDESPSLGHQSEDDGYMSMNGRKAKFALAFKPLTEEATTQIHPGDPSDFPPPPEEAERLIATLLPKVSPVKRNNPKRAFPVTHLVGRAETIPPPLKFQNNEVGNGALEPKHIATQTTLPKTRHQRPYGWENNEFALQPPPPPPGHRFGSLPYQHGIYAVSSPTRMPPRTVPTVIERHREVRRHGSEDDNLSSDDLDDCPAPRPLSELADDEHFSDDSLEELLPPPPPVCNKRSSIAWEVPLDDDPLLTPGSTKVIGRRRRKSGSHSSTSSIPNRMRELDEWPDPPPCSTEEEIASPFSDSDDNHLVLPGELSSANLSGTGTYVVRRKERRSMLNSLNSNSSLNSRLSSDLSIPHSRYSADLNSRLSRELQTPNSRYSIDLGSSNSRLSQELNSPKSRYSLDLNNSKLINSPSRLSSDLSSSRTSTPQARYAAGEFKKHSTTFDNIKSLIREGVIENCSGPPIESTTDFIGPTSALVRVVSLPALSAEELTPRRELAVTVEEEEDSESQSPQQNSSDVSPLRKIEQNISELLERRDIEISSILQDDKCVVQVNGFNNERKRAPSKPARESKRSNDLQKSTSHNEIQRSEDYYRQLLIEGGSVQHHPKRNGIQKSESAKEMLIAHRERDARGLSSSSSADFPVRVEVLQHDFPPLPPSPVEEDEDEYSEIANPLRLDIPSSEGPPAIPPHREAGSNSLKTRSMDAGYNRGRRNNFLNSSSRNIPPERRTLPTELQGPKRRTYQKRSSQSSRDEQHHMQTSCSLPETPIFARGCDIPRTPHRKAPDVPGSHSTPRQSSTMSNLNTIGNMSTGGYRRNSGLEQAIAGAELLRLAGGPGRGWYPKHRHNRPASIEHLDRLVLAPGQNPWDGTRKPLTLPPNLTPKFFQRSPRDALRRVTSLLIRKGNNGKEPKKEENEKQAPPVVAKYQEKETNGIGEEVVQQPKKKGFFKNFWKRSKHYSLEQQ